MIGVLETPAFARHHAKSETTKQSRLLLKKQAFTSRLLRWKAPPRWGGAFRLAIDGQKLNDKTVYSYNWSALKT
jgi:hypothetical protein